MNRSFVKVKRDKAIEELKEWYRTTYGDNYHVFDRIEVEGFLATCSLERLSELYTRNVMSGLGIDAIVFSELTLPKSARTVAGGTAPKDLPMLTDRKSYVDNQLLLGVGINLTVVPVKRDPVCPITRLGSVLE